MHTTEPTCFANKRCLRIAYIGNLNITKSCKYTSHIQHAFFKQYASLTKLSMSRYCPLTLIGCLLFSFEMRHTTEPWCSVVCVYTARLCAGQLGGVEGHPWVSGFWHWATPSRNWIGRDYFGGVPVLTICFRLFLKSHGRDVLFHCRDVRMHRIRFTGYRNMGRHSGPPCPSWWLSGRPLFCIKGLVIHTYISTYIDLEWFVDTLFRFHLFRIAWYIDIHHDRRTL